MTFHPLVVSIFLKSFHSPCNNFIEESLEQKVEYCNKYSAEILIMGDDHTGRFDDIKIKSDTVKEVIYLPRTPEISSSEIISIIKVSQ